MRTRTVGVGAEGRCASLCPTGQGGTFGVRRVRVGESPIKDKEEVTIG